MGWCERYVKPWLWVGLLLGGWLFPTSSFAQEPLRDLAMLDEVSTDTRVQKQVPSQRISSALRRVQDQMENQQAVLRSVAAIDYIALSNPFVRVDVVGRVQVYILVDQLGGPEEHALKAHGVEIEIANAKFNMVQGWVPVSQLEDVAELDFVRQIKAPDYGVARRGSVTTGGDVALNTDQVRALGFDGTGVKVGVISDGANNRGEAVSSGDLPANIEVFGSCVRIGAFTCNEGTAMLEIIHDLAPGAELGIGALDFSNATSLEFVNRIDVLSTTFGADIIVDDIGFFREPYFEDGMVALAVKQAVDSGIVYVSAAGNGAENHYEADFVPTVSQSLHLHDFGLAAGQNSDTSMDVLVGPLATLVVTLQWSDAFGNSGNDYDLLILNESEQGVPLASGIDQQDGDDDPSEIAFYENPTPSSVLVKLVVVRNQGDTRRLEMFVRGSALITEYFVPEGSVFGHPAVSGALATGAIDVGFPGLDESEPFSARGPSRIFHPVEEIRLKPDIAAVDRVAVTGAGGFTVPFSGTSAAAPHVAGVAALLYSAVRTATAAEVREAIVAGAVDLGAPGPDTEFGAGRVDAIAALQALGNVPPNGRIDTPTGDVTIAQGGTVIFTATGVDLDGDTSLTYRWDFDGAAPVSTLEDPGAVTFNNLGTFVVSLTTTDSLGISDASPDTRRITVVVTVPRQESGGGGGGCAMSPGASPDGVLLGMIGAILGGLGWRRWQRSLWRNGDHSLVNRRL